MPEHFIQPVTVLHAPAVLQLHLSQEEEALKVFQLSRHLLLQEEVSEGRLAPAQVKLHPSHGDGVRGEGSRGDGHKRHQDGRGHLHR